MRLRLKPQRVLITLAAITVVLGWALIRIVHGRVVTSTTTKVSVIRQISRAEATYADSYPQVGFAPNLMALGESGGDSCGAAHACLLDKVLACPAGVGQGWCEKSGYRYNIQSSSKNPPYKDYWLTVTPISRYEPSASKAKSYCLASDGHLRSEALTPLVRPYSLDECLALPPDLTGEPVP